MKSIFLTVWLLCLTLQQTPLVVSSASTTIITSIDNLVVGPAAQYLRVNLAGNALNIGYGAQWIWIDGFQWPLKLKLQFQTQFVAPCNGTTKLKIGADDEFEASLNGGPPMKGNVWYRVYQFSLTSLKCGINTLMIDVINHGGPAGLIFSIVQNQAGCFNCANIPLSFYNHNTCQCECNLANECSRINRNYFWFGYPICGCSCRPLNCSQNQFFNQKTCHCECKPKACLPHLHQSSRTCQCIESQ